MSLISHPHSLGRVPLRRQARYQLPSALTSRSIGSFYHRRESQYRFRCGVNVSFLPGGHISMEQDDDDAEVFAAQLERLQEIDVDDDDTRSYEDQVSPPEETAPPQENLQLLVPDEPYDPDRVHSPHFSFMEYGNQGLFGAADDDVDGLVGFGAGYDSPSYAANPFGDEQSVDVDGDGDGISGFGIPSFSTPTKPPVQKAKTIDLTSTARHSTSRASTDGLQGNFNFFESSFQTSVQKFLKNHSLAERTPARETDFLKGHKQALELLLSRLKSSRSRDDWSFKLRRITTISEFQNLLGDIQRGLLEEEDTY